jgi:hypothetical protein
MSHKSTDKFDKMAVRIALKHKFAEDFVLVQFYAAALRRVDRAARKEEAQWWSDQHLRSIVGGKAVRYRIADEMDKRLSGKRP